MTTIEIETFIRVAGKFVPVADVTRYQGARNYVEGAISLTIDDTEVFGLDLWDDVNWLWPLVIQAFEDCRNSGLGKRWFPDQPLSIVVEEIWGGKTRIKVADGTPSRRSAVAPSAELYTAVGRAANEFFSKLQRLVPGTYYGSYETSIIGRWNESGRGSGSSGPTQA